MARMETSVPLGALYPELRQRQKSVWVSVFSTDLLCLVSGGQVVFSAYVASALSNNRSEGIPGRSIGTS